MRVGRHSCAFVTQKATLLRLQFSRVKAGQIITLHYKKRKIPNLSSIQVLF